jgi:hypothetical protein
VFYFRENPLKSNVRIVTTALINQWIMARPAIREGLNMPLLSVHYVGLPEFGLRSGGGFPHPGGYPHKQGAGAYND